MGVYLEVNSPLESLEWSVDEGVLEPKFLLVHHIFGTSGDN